MIGTQVAHFRITAKLGQGGMGEVYRAEDSKLGRDVAIKALPEAFQDDPDRLGRFEREARVLASLNHPHIAAIHGVEEAEGRPFLVLELVEGPTLAERLGRGPFSIQAALEVSRQIAEALQAAHGKGIVHRDLKPANVKLTPEGRVKVLDFGLAKALGPEDPAPDLTQAPTLSYQATRAGMILGTAAYMAPEQAKGQPVDRRADIWAFGCVVYEMLSGRAPFAGKTMAELFASIVTQEPDWSQLPAETPEAVRRLLRRCLEKDLSRRLHDIADGRLEIEEALGATSDAVPEEKGTGTARRLGLWRAAALGLVVACLTAVLALWLRPGPELPVLTFELPIHGGHSVGVGDLALALSPDGRRLAFVSDDRLWVRDLAQLDPSPVPASEGARLPFWSPDGSQVGFIADRKIWRAALRGANPVAVAELGGELAPGAGATWTAAGDIVFSLGNTGLLSVPDRGGIPRLLVPFDPETESDFHEPHALPGGEGVLFIVHRTMGVDTLALVEGGRRRVLLQLEGQRLSNPVYSPSGHILFGLEPASPGVWAVPFSLSRLELTGEPFLVAPGSSAPSVAASGMLAFLRGHQRPLQQLALVNRRGEIESLVGEPMAQFPMVSLSPDGRRAATTLDTTPFEIWVLDLLRGTRGLLTVDDEPALKPSWSPDGERLAYTSGWPPATSVVRTRAADGSGPSREVSPGWIGSYSPDGDRLVVTYITEEGNWNIGTVELEGDAEVAPVVATAAREYAPEVSPDGLYLAYSSDESGRWEVYLTRFPSGEGRWQVSTAGGGWPRWDGTGRRLFYARGLDVMEVEVSSLAGLELTPPRPLFTRAPSGRPLGFGFPDGFDVARDGERFLVVRSVGPDTASLPSIVVLQNWLAEVQGRGRR